jgi:hypothetical protein
MISLKPKYTARIDAHTRLEAAAQAVERAKRLETTAAERARTLEQHAAQAESDQATQLAMLIASGGPSTELSTVPDEDLAAALATARSDLSIKAKALAVLVAVQEDAQAELTAAECAVENAVDKMLHAESETMASECIEIYERLTQKIAQLRAIVPDELNTPVHLPPDISPGVTRALNLVPPPDATMIPVNVLQFGTPGNAEAWAARRARMIAGEATEEDAAV